MILTGTASGRSGSTATTCSCSRDQMEIFDGHQVVATGNVLFVSGSNRIAAERLEFDTKTRTGTFYNASGIVSARGPGVDRSMFGHAGTGRVVPGRGDPQARPQEIQDRPRRLHHVRAADAALGNGGRLGHPEARRPRAADELLLRVKGVPVMYLPIFYYPVQEDDRATGFLMPVYGTVDDSRGRRSATRSSGRSAAARTRRSCTTGIRRPVRATAASTATSWAAATAAQRHLQRPRRTCGRPTSRATARCDTGEATELPDARRPVAGARPRAPRARQRRLHVEPRGRSRSYQQDISRRPTGRRNFGGNVTGNWHEYVLSATFEPERHVLHRRTTTRPLARLPRIYLQPGRAADRQVARSTSASNSEYVTMLCEDRVRTVTTTDRGLTRLDVNPVVRIPFTKWPFFTRQLDRRPGAAPTGPRACDPAGVQIPDGIGRGVLRLPGPDHRAGVQPDLRHAEQRLCAEVQARNRADGHDPADHGDRRVRPASSQIDGIDRIAGDVTKLDLRSQQPAVCEEADVARKSSASAISQTYYTDARASQVDPNYQTSYNAGDKPATSRRRGSRPGCRRPTSSRPTSRPSGTRRSTRSRRSPPAAPTTAAGSQVTGGWSRAALHPGACRGSTTSALANHDINATTTIHNPGNHLGGTYSFNYDLQNDNFRQQRIIGFYNSQCCGIASSTRPTTWVAPRSSSCPQDHRFNLSFTLAGIGTFSNFFGAFGGQQGR